MLRFHFFSPVYAHLLAALLQLIRRYDEVMLFEQRNEAKQMAGGIMVWPTIKKLKRNGTHSETLVPVTKQSVSPLYGPL